MSNASSHLLNPYPEWPLIKNQCTEAIKYKYSTQWKPCFTVYPKKYVHGFCFAVLCCGYTLTDFPISNRLTSLALWQSNDCPSASKATLMNMDKYFMWIHYEKLHNHNKATHNKTVYIFLEIYCIYCEHQWHSQGYFNVSVSNGHTVLSIQTISFPDCQQRSLLLTWVNCIPSMDE